MNWFTALFSGFQRSPEQIEVNKKKHIKRYNVQKLIVTVVENSGVEYVVTYDGYLFPSYSPYYGPLIHNAAAREFEYMRNCGKRGAAYIGNASYVPMCNVKKIKFDVVDNFVMYDTNIEKIITE